MEELGHLPNKIRDVHEWSCPKFFATGLKWEGKNSLFSGQVVSKKGLCLGSLFLLTRERDIEDLQPPKGYYAGILITC